VRLVARGLERILSVEFDLFPHEAFKLHDRHRRWIAAERQDFVSDLLHLQGRDDLRLSRLTTPWRFGRRKGANPELIFVSGQAELAQVLSSGHGRQSRGLAYRSELSGAVAGVNGIAFAAGARDCRSLRDHLGQASAPRNARG